MTAKDYAKCSLKALVTMFKVLFAATIGAVTLLAPAAIGQFFFGTAGAFVGLAFSGLGVLFALILDYEIYHYRKWHE